MNNIKFYLYLFTTVIVFYAIESLNINHIFKKNYVKQARLFYFLLALALIYIIANFIYDVLESTKIIQI